jgi:16S rRNA (guanine966-N2)-methyltransferase
MPDRVREAVFDVLGSWFGTPGRIPPVQVLDLFAGSGAMGLEAVSRGAVGCLFVERGKGAVRVLHSNLDALQADPPLWVVAADVWACPTERMRPGPQAVGLVFVDPPYRDSRNTAPNGKVPRLLDRLMRANLLTDDVVAVLHHERAVGYAPAAGQSWTLADRRDYGQTAISFVTRPMPEHPVPEEQASHGEQAPIETRGG